QPAGQAGDAVFLIMLALMRVPAGAIFTRQRAPLAHAAPPLIEHDAIAGAEVPDVRARLLHDAGDLMTEDLRLLGERDRPPALVAMVVAMPGVDVQVRAAQPYRCDLHPDVARPLARGRHFPHG